MTSCIGARASSGSGRASRASSWRVRCSRSEGSRGGRDAGRPSASKRGVVRIGVHGMAGIRIGIHVVGRRGMPGRGGAQVPFIDEVLGDLAEEPRALLDRGAALHRAHQRWVRYNSSRARVVAT